MYDPAFRIACQLTFEDAVDQVTAALATEGFGVLTQIDVKATLREKLDIDFRDYVILGACNPHLAHQALSSELEVGLLLPCNVVVYAGEDGGSVIAIIDPIEMLGAADHEALRPIAHEARERLGRVAQALGTDLSAVGSSR